MKGGRESNRESVRDSRERGRESNRESVSDSRVGGREGGGRDM